MGEHTEASALSLCSIFILHRSIPFVQGAFRDPETPDDPETISPFSSLEDPARSAKSRRSSAGATSANPTHTVRSLKVGRPDDLSISHHRDDGTLFFSLRMLSRLFTRYRPIKSTLNVYPVNRFATYSNMSSILEPIAKKFKASKVNCIPHVYGDRQLESYLPSLDWTNRPLERTRAHSMRMNPSVFPC